MLATSMGMAGGLPYVKVSRRFRDLLRFTMHAGSVRVQAPEATNQQASSRHARAHAAHKTRKQDRHSKNLIKMADNW